MVMQKIMDIFRDPYALDAENLPEQIADGIALLDVREENETAAGIIPGAVCLPLSILQNQLSILSKDKKWVVYCQSGARSKMACQILRQAGYEASNLKGGYFYWRQIQPN